MTLSIGIAGSTPAEEVRRIAEVVEASGYRALWVNDTPGGSALDALAVAAEVTSTLGLAAGVVPLDRVSAADLAARARDLPADRVRLGVGSGAAKRPLATVERGVEELRARTGTPILIGALGPRMRALAARIADGILFSWLTPDLAAEARDELRRDAEGRPVEGVLYARTIASPDARAALEAEAARYAGYPQYAAHFARLGLDPLDTTIELRRPGSAAGFQRAVDEVVLRIITPTGAVDDVLAAIRTRAVGSEETGIDRIEYSDLPPGTPI